MGMGREYEGRSEEIVGQLRRMGMVIKKLTDRIEAVGNDVKVVIFPHGGWVILRGSGPSVEARASVGNLDELLERLRSP